MPKKPCLLFSIIQHVSHVVLLATWLNVTFCVTLWKWMMPWWRCVHDKKNDGLRFDHERKYGYVICELVQGTWFHVHLRWFTLIVQKHAPSRHSTTRVARRDIINRTTSSCLIFYTLLRIIFLGCFSSVFYWQTFYFKSSKQERWIGGT